LNIHHTNRWQAYGRVVLIALLLAVGLGLLAPSSASASPGAPPTDVPAAIAVPPGHALLFSSRAVGVQIYTCQSGQWAFHAPRAELLDREYREQTATHFGGVDHGLTAGPWWQAVRDSSRVRAGNAVSAPSPNANSIPLLRLEVLERQGSGVLEGVTYIQRLNTTRGVGPTGACRDGARREVRYKADYYFYVAGPVPAGVPASLAIPEGQVLKLATRAQGVQIYTCVDGGWAFRAPRAELFDMLWGQQVATHYGGVDRRGLTEGPWWQSVRGASRIRAGNALSAPSPNANSIPLLRLEVLERTNGSFAQFNWIHRLNTVGGVGPTGACAAGDRREVPYTADYYFYGN
jgi:hypothetical protein